MYLAADTRFLKIATKEEIANSARVEVAMYVQYKLKLPQNKANLLSTRQIQLETTFSFLAT